MIDMIYVIGLDIGTTSTKAVLFKMDGSVVAESESAYPVYHPHPSWVEQDPFEIEAAAIEALQTVISKGAIPSQQIASVGISSAMHSLICMDENQSPLSASLTWADGRSVEQAEQLQRGKGKAVYLNTGTPIHPMSPLVKLIWMKENKYEPYKNAAKFISIKEFLLQRWFGQYVVDYSVASATGLFNIHTFTWEAEALQLAGISEDQLSTPVPPTYVCEGLKDEIATQIGIRSDLPFVIGASDGPLANLGIGAISPGDVAMTIGTSGAIRQMAAKPKTDELQEIFCYGLTKDLWIMGGPTNNGGIVLQWMKEVIGEHETQIAKQKGISAFEVLTDLAKDVRAGSDGVLFLPFLNGERAPYWDANARGSFVGLSLAHKKEHLVRASMEGVIFSMFSVGEALERLAGKPVNLFASGGFARSSLWLQIVADLFGHEVKVPESHQSSAWGAAWLSLVAIGKAQSLADIKHYIPMKDTFTPDLANHKTYQELYLTYRNLYDALKPNFETLANFQRNQNLS
ncbi:gluconokinase [Desertibacillus haloalkaliphilus]|uniref:gluconokinase n=1 Tax=Desertibacillus haloalkaliphilus TaxID=1328930 RepID=UPI001C26EB1B|nr:gluconokinase [Desertibacillus haloalkaliphilus]MBU8909014.1 gluconokinase [Desertibacillus haloalkaliphilus]